MKSADVECLKKPNIILVSFDDAVAYWPYKTAFNQPLKTPNLDKICSVSTAFHAAYTPATVCNPARASFMSGRTTHELKIFSNRHNVFELHDPRIMWSYRLKESGYFCSSGGKVHHGYMPVPQPAHSILYSDHQKPFAHTVTQASNTTNFGGYRGGLATVDPEDDNRFYDYNAAQSAIDFINTYDEKSPFYREIGFHCPHSPWATPSRFKQMYKLRNFQQPEEWSKGYDKNTFADRRFPKMKELSKGKIQWWKKSVRNYYSAYSLVDFHLGRVWDALKASKHAENTIVIILADHGFHLGNKDRLEKSSLWEQVANVPLIIHNPFKPEGKIVTDPVSTIDIGPTILDILGLGEIEGSVGISLRAHLDGQIVPKRTIPTFFWGNASIRKGKFRMIRYKDETTQLYDLKNDFWQLHDLGQNHPEHSHLLQELTIKSSEWGLTI